MRPRTSAACTPQTGPRGTRPPSATRAGSTRPWLSSAPAARTCSPVEHDLIGDLHGRCRRAIHLQCAGGRDTLSLWNLGADEVIGVDISPRMLDLAARLTAATGAPARWIECDVLDTPHELDGTADLLYTGRGAIMWLQDLDAWAAVLRRLLAPAGRLVIFDAHPAEWLFDTDDDGYWVATDYDYFAGPEASKGWAPEYIDALSIPEDDQSWKFARAWTLGEIVTALLGAGLRLERVTEHPVDWWGGHGNVRPGGARSDPAVVLGRRPSGLTAGPENVSRASRPQGTVAKPSATKSASRASAVPMFRSRIVEKDSASVSDKRLAGRLRR